MAEGLSVRWMIQRDIPSVLEIDSHSFKESWGAAELTHFRRQQNTVPLIVEDANEVVGFMLLWMNKRSILLERIAVHHLHRRQGVGSLLLDRVKQKTSGDVRRSIIYHCDERDLSAQLFLKASGFKACAVIHDHFEDGSAAYRFEWWHPSVVHARHESRAASGT